MSRTPSSGIDGAASLRTANHSAAIWRRSSQRGLSFWGRRGMSTRIPRKRSWGNLGKTERTRPKRSSLVSFSILPPKQKRPSFFQFTPCASSWQAALSGRFWRNRLLLFIDYGPSWRKTIQDLPHFFLIELWNSSNNNELRKN